ncbi:hypothetical protein JCM19241_3267 [Vibrio ishigakensis]|uniref:Lipoprotein n=1 Tax=Vibrio ishigakensis TaxID=1481914 RepID=A0A0B8Q6S5_9VIBR|nr:hypothetical protein JCM19241_3267 [Vibrio ishigakensis]
MRKLNLIALAVVGATVLAGCNPDSVADKIETKAQKEVLRHLDELSAAEVALTFQKPLTSLKPVATCYVRTNADEIAGSVSQSDAQKLQGYGPVSTKTGDTCSDVGVNSQVKDVQVEFDDQTGDVLEIMRSWANFQVKQDFVSSVGVKDYGQVTLRSPEKDVKGYDRQITISLSKEHGEEVVVKSGFVKHNADESAWTVSPTSTTYKNVNDLLGHNGIPNSVIKRTDANNIWDDNLLSL